MRLLPGRIPAPALVGLALVVLLPFLAAACGTVDTTAPVSSACPTGDQRAAKTYPDLEALLPLGMIERSPDSLDSGFNCSEAALGSYASHGLRKLRFAGATWDNGGGDGTVVAILDSENGALQPAWVEEFYEIGARSARKTENIETSRPSMRGAGEVFRLDALNDLSLQTIVVWPAGKYVRVVIVATTVRPDASRADHDQRVEMAVEVAAAVPAPAQ